jgi:hypothetical protein
VFNLKAVVMFTRDQARDFIISAFPRLIEAHKGRNFKEIHEGFDVFDRNLPRVKGQGWENFGIALNYWDTWIDAKNHNWQYYKPLTDNDWPNLA